MKFVKIPGNYEVELVGYMSPSQIRAFRKKLGLTQVQAAEIFGGGPNAFSRYELGITKPSRAACNLLILLSGMGYKNEA